MQELADYMAKTYVGFRRDAGQCKAKHQALQSQMQFIDKWRGSSGTGDWFSASNAQKTARFKEMTDAGKPLPSKIQPHNSQQLYDACRGLMDKRSNVVPNRIIQSGGKWLSPTAA